ncbi:hypothetical protein [Neolewinella agarilytica]|uniref:Transposase IS200-like domain-containing protein n=1 Tax=Neolewinella agarilytica TaxID=478744 RepID=A0A1H9DVK1_9BACT|nr:hypothetical protein [Neolewinella agarilytica]SEQ17436.1 hypothetical protein SAMN05444359_106147 [Neolewinella agarilytica]
MAVPTLLTSNKFQNDPLSNDPVHIIYRLYDSLPQSSLSKLSADYRLAAAQLKQRFPSALLLSSQHQNERYELQRKFQKRYDKLLDDVKSGPFFLSDNACKQIVIDSWLKMEEMDWVTVYAISVMSNHVHVLACHPDPNGSVDFNILLEKHKRFTATKINALQGQKGRRVWAKKAFDRRVRKGMFGSVFWYILNNPVKAKLAGSFEEFPGNYWHPDFG